MDTTWARLKDGSWGLRGHRLASGDEVDVVRKDGTQARVLVGEVVWRDPHDGTTLATVAQIKGSTRGGTGRKSRGSF